MTLAFSSSARLHMDPLSKTQILEAVQSCYGLRSVASASIAKSQRLYSIVWSVTISEGGAPQVYLVKQAGERAEKQAWLSQRADGILQDQPVHHSADIRYDPEHHLTISRLFPGRSLEAVIAEGGLTRPIAWYRELHRIVHLAGVWLRQYHSVGRRAGALSGPLMRYLEERAEKLDRLPHRSRQRLMQLVGGDVVDDLVVTHGDFSPGNILAKEGKLCIIDFGISEWTEMSPWWDVTTLLFSLDRQILFRKRCLVYWVRPLLPRLRSAFWAGYGDKPPAGARSFLACAAVRHFSLAGDLTPQSLEDDPRARWHVSQLDQILQGI